MVCVETPTRLAWSAAALCRRVKRSLQKSEESFIGVLSEEKWRLERFRSSLYQEKLDTI
jgi:hypothetical protein